MNKERVKALLTNTYAFCPMCAMDTLQNKLKNGNMFCNKCKNIFKITKNLIKDRHYEGEFIDDAPSVNSFEGWDEKELKEEINRLQQILDSKGIGY